MKYVWKTIFIIVFAAAHVCKSQIEIETNPIKLVGKNTYSILRKSQKILQLIVRLTKSLKDLNRILNGYQISNTSVKQPSGYNTANPIAVNWRPYTEFAKKAMQIFKTKNCSIDFNFDVKFPHR
ncbi:hypothetical protein B566_EDAN007268 [Ephemera danica]|nr:hypothetical protein B566_EDAN007268 [Ephemera danica]